MAYNFVRLNETPLTENPVAPNILIEDDGEIKRFPIEHIIRPAVQSDWEEEDGESPAFILNKPEGIGEQIQSDWNEQDASSPAYILNKPDGIGGSVQSDWNEDDSSSPAFILNKPESFGSRVVKYLINSGRLVHENNQIVDTQSVIDDWNNGNVIRIVSGDIWNHTESTVVGLRYGIASGGGYENGEAMYIDGNEVCTVSF